MYLKLFAVVCIIFGMLGCERSSAVDDDPETGFNETCSPASYPGLNIIIDGDVSSDIDPMSTEFTDYISCIQGCAQTSLDDPSCMMDCLGILGTVPAGGAFSLALDITNTTSSEITYVVEPGDWFTPGSEDYQPMMSSVAITKAILPGETVTLTVPVYCLASSKSAPDVNSEYSMCTMISSSGCLAEIVAILATKDQSSFGFDVAMRIQQIIWNCTEGNEVDWDYLNSLPSL